MNKTHYHDALSFQQQLFHAQLKKKAQRQATNNFLILLQHYPIYTLGKSGDINNLKVPLRTTGADYFKTDRGGDITYHGPGQLVGYPIFDLERFGIGVKEYVRRIEQCIIDCIAHYGLKGERISDASGVWLDADSPDVRKICAIGIKVSRGITMHGFAFNVNTDLSFFDNITPCGLENKGVTSLEKELGEKVNLHEVEQLLLESFQRLF